jgi:hypothetical protein
MNSMDMTMNVKEKKLGIRYKLNIAHAISFSSYARFTYPIELQRKNPQGVKFLTS